MTIKFAFALAVLAFVASVRGSEPVELEQTFERPNYLVPVAPDRREYEESISRLLNGRAGKGTMIYYESPYTGSDFVVSVWGRDYSGENYKHARHNFITLVEVSPTDEHKNAIAKKEIEIPIDDELAVAVQRAWATMLLKTRYPMHRYLTLNGWQTEFSVEVQSAGRLYGQLNSPAEGLPKQLMDLGFALADYCKSPQAERTQKREKLVSRLVDFQKRAEKD